MLFTAHSPGKNKLEYLEANGWTREKAEKTFAIGQRIQTEENILGNTNVVITSTHHEKEYLYRDYQNKGTPSYAVSYPIKRRL